MNNFEMIHETELRDIVNIILGAKDAITDNKFWSKYKNAPRTGSIARQASGLTLVFPVIISNNLNIDTAMIISKAIERKCVSLLQILFSSISYTDAKDVNNVQDFVGIFHKNLDPKLMDFDDFVDAIDLAVQHNSLTITDNDAYEAVMEDMKHINYHLKTDFNKTSINDYKIISSFGEQSVVCESPKFTFNGQPYDGRFDSADQNININMSVKMPQNKDKNLLNAKDQADILNKQILPAEIKKANELMPTLMYVNFKNVKDGNVIDTTGVVGVKAKLYPVDSNEIINRVVAKNKDANGLFSLVRASTREISFFKDFLFAIDKAKMDAINVSKNSDNASMFKVLERRAAKNKVNKFLRKNDASPITSLVISQNEVEYIKQFNLDLEKSSSARTILEAYNLMDIVIADETLEIAKFLFDDGDGVFEAVTFDALEKQNSDNSTKKIVNLLSKANR